MSRKTVAELLVDVLAEAGVERVYGVPGDSLNGITDSIRVRQDISWVGVRHEEAAAFAAGGLLNAEQFDSWVRPEEMTHPLGGK
jgi:pyruvate dehydrogenase (quinone)